MIERANEMFVVYFAIFCEQRSDTRICNAAYIQQHMHGQAFLCSKSGQGINLQQSLLACQFIKKGMTHVIILSYL